MKLGNAVESVIKKTGLNKLASDDCGCDKRKETLNNVGEKISWFSSNIINRILK